MISLGIQKNGDKYTFKKDDDLYRELKTLKQQTQNYHHTEDERLANLIQSYDFDEFKTIYDKYQQHKQKPTEPISDSDITTMNCKDLFKFKNIKYAKKLLTTVKKFIVGSTEIVLTETGCLLTSFLNLDEFDQTQILNMGLDATATDTKDDRGPWTRVPRQIKCNNGLELLNEYYGFT